MFKNKLLQGLIIVFLAFGVLSCPLSSMQSWGVLDTGEFYAVDASTGGYYVLKADLLSSGKYCNIWVEQTQKGRVNSQIAENIAHAFDFTIYPNMISVFSFEPNAQSGWLNAMEYADWLGNGDGKLTILLLDIQDGHSLGSGAVAGYFSESDFLTIPNYPSNRRDMIYIDTYPGSPGSAVFNATIAHEMQHMMSYATAKAFGLSSKDIWIDEGLATAAEYVYLSSIGKGHPEDRYGWYNRGSESLARGNNFFVWDNHQDDPNAALDDYATVYLFFQWLRLQSENAGVKDIYKQIMASPQKGYEAVTNAAHAAMPGNGYDNWETLLKTWLAANYINAPTGAYGYWDDPNLKSIKVTGAPIDNSSLKLAPGEGVYSGITGNTPLFYLNKGSIRYVWPKKSPASLSSTPGTSDKVLLTFNANTTGKTTEDGLVTGLPLPAEGVSNQMTGARSADGGYSGRIGLREALARNGHGTELE